MLFRLKAKAACKDIPKILEKILEQKDTVYIVLAEKSQGLLRLWNRNRRKEENANLFLIAASIVEILSRAHSAPFERLQFELKKGGCLKKKGKELRSFSHFSH
jgi:hypothetical protein